MKKPIPLPGPAMARFAENTLRYLDVAGWGKKDPHAVALGRKGGLVKSDRKAESSRANGKKGGRPKNQKKNTD